MMSSETEKKSLLILDVKESPGIQPGSNWLISWSTFNNTGEWGNAVRVCVMEAEGVHGVTAIMYTVIPRLTSDPANEFFG